MQYFRIDRISPVWREVPKEKTVVTLFGTKEVKLKYCPCCKQYLPVVDFYLESKSKSKYPDQLRNMCARCWDIYEGRLTPFLEEESGIDVFGEHYSILNQKKTFKRKSKEPPELTIDRFLE